MSRRTSLRDPSDGRTSGCEEETRRSPRRYNPVNIFVLLILTGSLVNFDSGGTAAVLVFFGKGCDEPEIGMDPKTWVPDHNYPCLSEADKGVLGAVPYIGLCVGCPLVGQALLRFSEKEVLVWSLVGNVLATIIFATVVNTWYLWSTKFVVGFTQSTISIYGAVWVAKFGPPKVKTLWYGLMQSATAIGNLIGYAVCGYLVDLGVFYQHAFQIQAFALLVICFVFWPIPNWKIDVSAHSRRSKLSNYEELVTTSQGSFSDTDDPNLDVALPSDPHERLESPPKPEGQQEMEDALEAEYTSSDLPLNEMGLGMEEDELGILAQIEMLSNYPVYLGSVIALCGIYYISTAIQYWASEYFIVEYHREGAEVTSTFLLVAGSAPILGVFGGSIIIDRNGGYDTPKQLVTAALLTTSWGFGAAVSAFGAVVMGPVEGKSFNAWLHFYAQVMFIWFILLFGGAMVPAITGIMMAAVPEDLRKSASSWSMFLCNVFGFAIGAVLPGYIAQCVSLRFAMQVSFLWVVFPMSAMIFVYFQCRRQLARGLEHNVLGL